jgi:hypothetical protein
MTALCAVWRALLTNAPCPSPAAVPPLGRRLHSLHVRRRLGCRQAIRPDAGLCGSVTPADGIERMRLVRDDISARVTALAADLTGR